MRRTILALGLNAAAILTPAIAVVFITQRIETNTDWPTALPYILYTLVFPLLWLLQQRLSFNATAAVFIAALLGLGFIVQIRGGLNFSTAAIQVWILLLSGLLFGPRAVLLTTTISLLGFALSGVAILNNWVPPTVDSFWSQDDPLVWLRSGILLAVFGITSATAVATTISRMDNESVQLRASLERESAQNRALALAEKEQESIRNTLAEAQRVEALGRLASGVAHDFNNSLTIITNSAEIAQLQMDNPEKLHRSLYLIKNTALEAAKMTNSLLAFGRKEPSKKELIPVQETIARLSENLTRLLPEDITLKINALPAGHIFIDRSQLERAILNLVVNAKDAIEQDGVIEVGCELKQHTKESHEQLSDHAWLYIKDNGAGMTNEVRDRIFEPFFTTKKSGSGIGLGMALLQSLVDEAQGHIEVESEPGRGTLISMYLPTASSANDIPNAKPAASASELALTSANAHLLLVEDNPDVLATSLETLESKGYRVTTAANGDDALQLVLNPKLEFDLMCIDGVIPGVSSGEIINRMQALHPATRIVVCSGYIEEELILRGIRAGELAYISKPYSSEVFLKIINEELIRAT
jgi:signal transduction histidine kinase/ActR/RegA family two-component response regulator